MGILSKIKELIDPIDLAILETHLGKNVERFYARNCLLLGVFTSHNETPVDLYTFSSFLFFSSFSFLFSFFKF